MTKRILNITSFIMLCAVLGGLLWTISSCIHGGGVSTDNPTQSPEGFVDINLSLDRFDPVSSLPTSFLPAGTCAARTISLFDGTNTLCRTSGALWRLNNNIVTLTSDEVLLKIDVDGTSGYARSIIVAESDINRSNGFCTARITLPTDQTSTLKIQLIDVCCPFNTRRLQWLSKMGDLKAVINSSVPVTQTAITAGTSVPQRLINLIPYTIQPCN